jgi:hypothetical protein
LIRPTKIKTATITSFMTIDLHIEDYENISFILYLTPLLTSTFYAISIWIPKGFSFSIPLPVYLTVTKDPYLFIFGLISVCLAVLLEIYVSPINSRLNNLIENCQQVQILALICVASTLISAWSTTNYSLNTYKFLETILEGRYALIYPINLFMLSLLLNPSIRLELTSLDNIIEKTSLILLISSPLIMYMLFSLQMPWIIIITSTLITLLIGLVLLYRSFGLGH